MASAADLAHGKLRPQEVSMEAATCMAVRTDIGHGSTSAETTTPSIRHAAIEAIDGGIAWAKRSSLPFLSKRAWPGPNSRPVAIGPSLRCASKPSALTTTRYTLVLLATASCFAHLRSPCTLLWFRQA
jgi:hypothetical protein